jgi:N-acetylmuramoyl-L-alanine amidase
LFFYVRKKNYKNRDFASSMDKNKSTGAKIVKFSWIPLSLLAFLLSCSPAWAGRLTFWRFESSQNRLVFTTDEGVQPRAQLIPNPTRLVIDLPNTTLGKQTINQPLTGVFRNLRVGQFDAETARIVIELVPGYTLDPQAIRFQGASPTQWSVTLPTPQKVEEGGDSSFNNNPPSNNRPSGSYADFQVTDKRLFVRINSRGSRRISTNRSEDGRRIEFVLEGANLPSTLSGQSFAVNRYGVGQIEFERVSSSSSRIILNVTPDSPDWSATYTGVSGVVIVPKDDLDDSQSLKYPESPDRATIQSVQLIDNSQLLISANMPIAGNGKWNEDNGVYEILIPNAQLPDRVQGPKLTANSPISRVRIRQHDEKTVLVLVQPASGVKLGELYQKNNDTLALDARNLQASVPYIEVTVPPPEEFSGGGGNDNIPPPNYGDSGTDNTVPKTGIVVVIDPGHGGKDPGTIGIGGIQEKNIILPVALEVTKILQQQGIRVIMTRDSDYFVSLEGRTQMANRAGADLFVSIHANAINLSRPEVNGLEVYYYGDRRLSDAIQRNILRNVNVSDRGVRKARFYVLRNSKMPATLVELGFLTGNVDSQKLQDPSYRSQMAQAIARGIIEYIKQNL